MHAVFLEELKIGRVSKRIQNWPCFLKNSKLAVFLKELKIGRVFGRIENCSARYLKDKEESESMIMWRGGSGYCVIESWPAIARGREATVKSWAPVCCVLTWPVCKQNSSIFKLRSSRVCIVCNHVSRASGLIHHFLGIFHYEIFRTEYILSTLPWLSKAVYIKGGLSHAESDVVFHIFCC